MPKLHVVLRSIVLVCAVPLAAGQTTAPTSNSPAARNSSSAPRTGPDPALLHPEALKEKAPEVYEVKFATTKGDFLLKVTRAWAPLGADRFYNLARHHFYDGASFFRVLPGFVVQFGISPYPQVSEAWRNARIKDDAVKQKNRRGFVSFATSGPHTRTTQVFVNLADNSALDGMGFSPFAEVVEGMNVVEQLYSGYGEGAPAGRGPRQDLIEARGKAYLDKEFAKLDSIKTAILVGPEGSEGTPPGRPPSKGPAKSPSKAPAKNSP
ncbi:MAG TPA: peptidylprolyl isomerase [Candidatus Acidoferrales bacterium]|nr:peptidylprolyl isomerase [Candidatus Acidoferrales bacterium]